MASFGPLVSAGWLAEHLADPDLRVIDFRWYLDGRSGLQAYHAGHIPDAVFVDLEDVTGRDGPGRHPLPTAEEFEARMRAAGVSRHTRVVVYDDLGGYSAARLWWLLRHFGHAAQAVLDGGLQAWNSPLSRDDPRVQPGDFTARVAADDVVDVEAVRASLGERVLIDARAPERYRGETEPIDARAGHIPGARSRPWELNLGPDRRFLPPAELRRGFAALGLERGDQAICYCGSGVTACHDLLALEVAGLAGGRLYEGSWSDWSSRSDLPAATGPAP